MVIYVRCEGTFLKCGLFNTYQDYQTHSLKNLIKFFGCFFVQNLEVNLWEFTPKYGFFKMVPCAFIICCHKIHVSAKLVDMVSMIQTLEPELEYDICSLSLIKIRKNMFANSCIKILISIGKHKFASKTNNKESKCFCDSLMEVQFSTALRFKLFKVQICQGQRSQKQQKFLPKSVVLAHRTNDGEFRRFQPIDLFILNYLATLLI